ncbi:YicC family protein [Phaeobacter gallaeciensis]|uniref:YicC/YloC family endoribonuclease n=1 Tax=Phaeobacter gallaeciensis TaxID=60890 RepID=UPI00237FCA19|nr:YicC/YloC family endoribonuclease [Phaeobacter gallaeciensis]MDE4302599.1 YicC family protein [Phaeobacter gallaeciensis]MDE4307307.1 YicC family protein [Phaeobacter gallaeciensis]MDE4311772.1 YicC family protein [Phaeobacter gallaeciensis]MDE4315921.1 YicC family protein [Phaeobacter gallaeciensis]MDE4320699.1 YicC family protein [Phaeobacter gallaeciensis]
MTVNSMTGFASAQGGLDAHSWGWEIRSVNAKGLDLRLRIPDWLEGLEPFVRSTLSKSLSRGNISLTLRLTRREEGGGPLQLNPAALTSVLEALAQTEAAAQAAGVDLKPSSASDILALRGVMEHAVTEDDPVPLVAALKDEFLTLLAGLTEMRRTEGAQLLNVLKRQLDQVEALSASAAALAEERKPRIAETLKTNLERVLANSDGMDPDRLAQELALIAVKADVTEEIDRLAAHVRAARELLEAGGPIGRKLDFLMQEFNREANTLCSKAQSSDLTAVGLELKAIIDQMREQVQNIE